MEKKTVRAFYDGGEVRFLEPVHMDGCWNLEITFVEQGMTKALSSNQTPIDLRCVIKRTDWKSFIGRWRIAAPRSGLYKRGSRFKVIKPCNLEP